MSHSRYKRLVNGEWVEYTSAKGVLRDATPGVSGQETGVQQ